MFLKDMSERAVKTFLQAFVAVYLASPLDIQALMDLSVFQKAAVAGGVALLSMATSVLSTRFGSTDSASMVQ